VELRSLENQIVEFLEQISIADKLHQYAVTKLTRMRKDKYQTQEMARASLKKEIEALDKELENLTTLRLRDLITDEEFSPRRSALQREQLKSKERLDMINKLDSWFELSQAFISFSNRAVNWFKAGNSARKRLILEIVGSNFSLK